MKLIPNLNSLFKIFTCLFLLAVTFTYPTTLYAQESLDTLKIEEGKEPNPADPDSSGFQLVDGNPQEAKNKPPEFGDSFTEFLDYEIFSYNKYKFTVYRLLMLMLIIVVVRVVIWGAEAFINRRIGKRKAFTEGRVASVIQLVKYFVYIIGFAFALESVGVDVKILLLSTTGLLLGLGLGLQEMFKDVASGVAILFEQNIKVGDVVEMDDMVCTVKEINLRTCEVETRDGTYVIVPNSKFVNGEIINWTHNFKKTRFRVSVGVAYGSDVEKVREILINCANEHEDVMKTPSPFVTFENFGNSSLDFGLYFWSRKLWEAEILRSDVRFSINRAFKENNITIPFPQLDLHYRSNDTIGNEN